MIWNLKQYGESTALIQGDEEVSYLHLAELSDGIAARVGERTLVFILCSNTVGSIAGYVGFVNHGIVPLLLDAGLNQGLLEELIRTYQPEYIWAPEARENLWAESAEVYSGCGYRLWKCGWEEKTELYPELGVLISTSGSTGSPKLVRQTYGNIRANTESIVEYLQIDRNERAITTLPMNYVYGLSVVNTHLYAGAVLVLTDLNCYAKKFWELFRQRGATSFAGVPFMYEMMDKLKVMTKVEVPTLRTMTQAGGKLSPDLQRKFSLFAADTGRRFIVMYGASEATARMGYLPMEYALSKEGSMGIAIPGGRFELYGEEGQLLEGADQAGELVYYGPNVTLGYAQKKEDLAKGDENHGRLVTGDVARRDEDGFYYIVGRKKRFIKILGKRVNLDELDRLLKKEFSSIDIACAGHDDLLGVFVLDESLAGPIPEYIFRTMEINRNLIRVKVVPEIPKNPSGKILYDKLNKQLD